MAHSKWYGIKLTLRFNPVQSILDENCFHLAGTGKLLTISFKKAQNGQTELSKRGHLKETCQRLREDSRVLVHLLGQK